MSPFTTFSFSLSSFDFPLPSKRITLLVCQLSLKRLQASFLNNRSNQLPSLPLCVSPLLHSLFQQRVQREDNFSEQCWEENGRGEEKGEAESDKEGDRGAADWSGSCWFKESRGASDSTTVHADVCRPEPRQANAQLLYNP